ncbi:GumC family protein [Maribacter polysaccharolyticus]|uniref:GumC family protein n=1 Tax=Maribacter polysaccharolyticus TaxID=3020831 RepID=UPI00237FC818|nr:polysaccharide biosynthesis tyrosine autokinase [Maribacter polysaccharolyticus]MDE3741471.1 polysaccharide biosynthesis tyrosine autokinase [Maribacter polysaccharolyticus]
MNELKNEFLDSEENNLGDIFKKYLKYWPLFAIGIIIGLTVAFLHLRYRAEPEYQISSTILIKNKGAGKGIGEMDGFNNLGLVKTTQSLEDEIGILTSSGIMEEVISKNSFNIDYFIEGTIRDVEIYGDEVPVQIMVDETAENLVYGLPINIRFLNRDTYELSTTFNDKELVSEHAFGDLVVLPYGTMTIVPKANFSETGISRPLFFKIVNKDRLAINYVNRLSIYPDNDTGSLLRLNFVLSHRKKGEEVLSKVIETYIEKTIKYENELAENTIKMIDDRLKLLSGEIEDVENTVVDFKRENVVTDVASNADSYIQQANEYKKQVAEYDTQINVLSNIEQSLIAGDMSSTIGGSYSINDPALMSLINKYNEAFIKKQGLSQSAVTSNPLIVSLDASLKSLRASILQNVKSNKNGLIIARGNLYANASRYDAQIAKVPGMEKELLEISRDKSTKEGLYLYLLQKREEEVLSMAAPVSSTRIVNLPKAGLNPISPNKKMFYLSGLLLGVFIPFSLVYMKEALNTKVRSIEDLSKSVTAPVLGKISRSKDKTMIDTDEDRDSPTAELFRLLRFNLDYLKQTDRNQTILVTSSVKGEGKTFIASNLAVTLASNGEKVVVLAFDLREPQLMDDFGLPNSPGISDFILKKGMSLDGVIQQHPNIENLSLIGSGMVASHLGSLMLSKRIDLLMDALKKEYDRIIIDTAPIGLVSDAFALNAYLDSTIYVVRKDVTQKEHLKNINAIHKSNKLKNCMVLLNDDTEAVETYGYGKYGK